ncbi:MAG TPA: tripartite tricarboxylate transporter substrate binding protein [Burkholderiales bacterium]|nr:tripartite tricarboxylate transporter substrate binding protein [Burkholderiales bacterium]
MAAFLFTIVLVAALAARPGAAADAFPSRPVRIVVPYAISGPPDIRGTTRVTRTYRAIAQHAPPAISDVLARIAAQGIEAGSPHRPVLERHPGAVTARGALVVARAPADGHTLLLASNATMVINPHYFHGVPYDPERDFVAVAPLATMPFVLVVNASLPAETVPELIAWLRPRLGEVNYASSGDGSTGHLAGELFRRMARVSIVHVSYNGGTAALNGLAAGQVSVMFAALPLVLPYLENRAFRALGLTSARRFERLPELPTLAEAGLPGYSIEGWFGIFARARTPAGPLAWLRERVSSVIAEPATRAVLLSYGLDPARMSLEQFATRIHTETERWAPVLRASRLPRDRES